MLFDITVGLTCTHTFLVALVLTLSGDIELCVRYIHHNTLSHCLIIEESTLSVYHLDSLNVFIV